MPVAQDSLNDGKMLSKSARPLAKLLLYLTFTVVLNNS
jgi:hypothetical protein